MAENEYEVLVKSLPYFYSFEELQDVYIKKIIPFYDFSILQINAIERLAILAENLSQAKWVLEQSDINSQANEIASSKVQEFGRNSYFNNPGLDDNDDTDF